jgi:ketosteroid isomerase-like protein
MRFGAKFIQRSAVLLLLLAAVAALSLPLFALVNHGKKHEYRQEIEAMEDQWRDAMLSNNIAALDKLTSDDYTAINANGTIETKQQFLDHRKSARFQISTMELSDRRIRFYGSTAVVTSLAKVTGKNSSGNASGNFRYTRVYNLNSSGKWWIVSFEASRVRDPNDRR